MTNFEHRLVEALQPIRGMALANGIYHMFASGVHAALTEGQSHVDDLAEHLSLVPERLDGFLRYLANEDLIGYEEHVASLTARSRGLTEFRPWYELLIGGYAQTFQQITKTLAEDVYADRDGELVGIGSCGISRFDALPLIRDLLTHLPERPGGIVDIGCGGGDVLVDLIRDYPDVDALGVDPYAPVERGDGRPGFHRASAVDYVRSLESAAPGTAPRLFIAAFLLQEILEQEGRNTVVELVRGVVNSGARLAVVEVDHRPDDPAVMRHGLGLSYYNPYYFLHTLTEQRLETTGFWLELFEEAGAEVLAHRVVDPAVDSTGLEFGCLLAAKGDRS